jgi:hypothetical protein
VSIWKGFLSSGGMHDVRGLRKGGIGIGVQGWFQGFIGVIKCGQGLSPLSSSSLSLLLCTLVLWRCIMPPSPSPAPTRFLIYTPLLPNFISSNFFRLPLNFVSASFKCVFIPIASPFRCSSCVLPPRPIAPCN